MKFGKQDATDEQILEVLKQCNAYDFVMKDMKQGLDTWVGSSGGQLSGKYLNL